MEKFSTHTQTRARVCDGLGHQHHSTLVFFFDKLKQMHQDKLDDDTRGAEERKEDCL